MMTAGPLGLPIMTGMLLKNATKDDHMPTSEAFSKVMEDFPGMRLAEDVKDPKNFLQDVLRGQSEKLAIDTAKVEESKESIEKAIAYVSDCRFNFDRGSTSECYVPGGLTAVWSSS